MMPQGLFGSRTGTDAYPKTLNLNSSLKPTLWVPPTHSISLGLSAACCSWRWALPHTSRNSSASRSLFCLRM